MSAPLAHLASHGLWMLLGSLALLLVVLVLVRALFPDFSRGDTHSATRDVPLPPGEAADLPLGHA